MVSSEFLQFYYQTRNAFNTLISGVIKLLPCTRYQLLLINFDKKKIIRKSIVRAGLDRHE